MTINNNRGNDVVLLNAGEVELIHIDGFSSQSFDLNQYPGNSIHYICQNDPGYTMFTGTIVDRYCSDIDVHQQFKDIYSSYLCCPNPDSSISVAEWDISSGYLPDGGTLNISAGH